MKGNYFADSRHCLCSMWCYKMLNELGADIIGLLTMQPQCGILYHLTNPMSIALQRSSGLPLKIKQAKLDKQRRRQKSKAMVYYWWCFCCDLLYIFIIKNNFIAYAIKTVESETRSRRQGSHSIERHREVCSIWDSSEAKKCENSRSKSRLVMRQNWSMMTDDGSVLWLEQPTLIESEKGFERSILTVVRVCQNCSLDKWWRQFVLLYAPLDWQPVSCWFCAVSK